VRKDNTGRETRGLTNLFPRRRLVAPRGQIGLSPGFAL
jgi:hypothetical protein